MVWDKLLISADSHVVEPADLFAKTLGDKHGDKVPRFVGEYQGVEGRYYFTGKEYLRLSVLLEGDDAEQDKRTKAGRDPGFRLQCLDEDGIFGRGPVCLIDPAYDACACDTREGWEPYRSVHYDPLWARAEEIGIPLSLHIPTGNEQASFTLHGDDRSQGVRRSLGVFHEAFPTLANEFIFGGVFDRFPKLNIMLAEFEVSWLIYWMFRVEQFETQLRSFGRVTDVPSGGSATIWAKFTTARSTSCISTRFST